jgi:diguanylate cyclase (GGDEF)-like protein
VDWSQIPDLAAVSLLAGAFASIAKQSRTRASGIWLICWLMICLHFVASILAPLPGAIGNIAAFVSLSALADAGILFMYSTISYHDQISNRWMLMALLSSTTLYLGLLTFTPLGSWTLIPAAILLGGAPLLIAVVTLRSFQHQLRWWLVGGSSVLAVYLLCVQCRAVNGPELALNGILFTLYAGCCIHFWYIYRKASAGALISIAGFGAWALVFLIGPLMDAYFPAVHVQGEVWNLPKYLVAVGMILLLLEEQIEHNKYLALHDELTGLPNRRLFQDRLKVAIDRARRQSTSTSLLVIDLNGFKAVNDSLGHHAGDTVLKLVASAFANRVRRCDTVARTGGDEFSVVLEEPTNRSSALQVADSLLQLLAKPIQAEGISVVIGASIGVAVFPEDATSEEALCIAADRQMYRDKQELGQTTRPERPQLTNASMCEASTVEING